MQSLDQALMDLDEHQTCSQTCSELEVFKPWELFDTQSLKLCAHSGHFLYSGYARTRMDHMKKQFPNLYNI